MRLSEHRPAFSKFVYHVINQGEIRHFLTFRRTLDVGQRLYADGRPFETTTRHNRSREAAAIQPRGVSLVKALGDLVLVEGLGADGAPQVTIDVITNRFATGVTSRDAAVAAGGPPHAIHFARIG